MDTTSNQDVKEYTLTKKTVKKVSSPLAKKKEMPVSVSKTLKKKPLKKK